MKRLDMVFLNVILPLTVDGHHNTPSGKNGGPSERRRAARIPVQIIFWHCDLHKVPAADDAKPSMMRCGQLTIADLPQWQRLAVLSPAPSGTIYPQVDSRHIGALIIAEFHRACRRHHCAVNAG
jgi:hypothetical protein